MKPIGSVSFGSVSVGAMVFLVLDLLVLQQCVLSVFKPLAGVGAMGANPC
jgi:hypothetical protein